jgi:hypothetical protein
MAAPRDTIRDLVTVAELVRPHSPFTAGALRYRLFQRRENGLDAAVVRVGHRVLIDRHAFNRWLDNQRERRGGA